MEKPTVLVVDDQSSNLVAFEALLEDFDIELLEASSGQQALELLEDHDVALVLLDVQMPGMDGYEVARFMQEGSKTHNIPIIFVTAINRDIEHVLRGYDSGAVDFLTKPVDSRVFQSKVQVFLDLHQKTRKLQRTNQALETTLSEVERLKHHNDLLLRSIGEGVLSLDRRGNVIYANPSAQALFDETSPIAGQPLGERLPGDNARKHLEDMLTQCLGGQRWEGVLPMLRHDSSFPADIIATPLSDDKGHIAGVSLSLRDATDRQRRELALRAETERDPLTGLCNRRGFERLLHNRLTYDSKRLALLYLDLDEFKPVNDRLGHQAGDKVLTELATRFQAVMRQTDLIARVGGDEFCVLVSAPDPEQAAVIVAEKLLDVANQPLALGGMSMTVGASVGIALPSLGSTPVTLMHRADQAMYMAKREGGARYQMAAENSRPLAAGSGAVPAG